VSRARLAASLASPSAEDHSPVRYRRSARSPSVWISSPGAPRQRASASRSSSSPREFAEPHQGLRDELGPHPLGLTLVPVGRLIEQGAGCRKLPVQRQRRAERLGDRDPSLVGHVRAPDLAGAAGGLDGPCHIAHDGARARCIGQGQRGEIRRSRRRLVGHPLVAAQGGGGRSTTRLDVPFDQVGLRAQISVRAALTRLGDELPGAVPVAPPAGIVGRQQQPPGAVGRHRR